MSRVLFALACVALLAFLSAPVAARPSVPSLGEDPTWQLCPDAPTDMRLNNVTLSLVGHNIAMVLNATVTEQLEVESTVNLGVLLEGGLIFSQTLDMSSGTKMPVNGNFLWKYAVEIPSIAPSGNYEVDLTFSNDWGIPVTCLEVKFRL